MAIEDLKPDGYSDQQATYAIWTRKPTVTAQGMWQGKYALWLDIDHAGRTLIGYGLPEEALQEGIATLDALKAEMTKSLEYLRMSKGELAPNV